MKIKRRPKVSAVYQILNMITGKKYIGASSDVLKRFGKHERSLRNGRHPNLELQKDYLDFGKKAFSYDIIEITPDRDFRERFLLERADNSFLYNKMNTNSYETFDNNEIIDLGKKFFSCRTECFNENHRLYTELNKRRLLDHTWKLKRPRSLGKEKHHFCFFSEETNKVFFNYLANDKKRNLSNFHQSHSDTYQVIKIDASEVETFKHKFRDLGYQLYESIDRRYRPIQ